MIKRVFTSLKGLKGIDSLPAEALEKLDEHIRIKAVDRAEEKMLLIPKEEDSFSDERKLQDHFIEF
tara:strand:- start:182 stop:379 length:198 start_codon:yes stop_codon:yes gene_type:complete